MLEGVVLLGEVDVQSATDHAVGDDSGSLWPGGNNGGLSGDGMVWRGGWSDLGIWDKNLSIGRWCDMSVGGCSNGSWSWDRASAGNNGTLGRQS